MIKNIDKTRDTYEIALTLAVLFFLSWLSWDFGSDIWLQNSDGRFKRDISLKIEDAFAKNRVKELCGLREFSNDKLCLLASKRGYLTALFSQVTRTLSVGHPSEKEPSLASIMQDMQNDGKRWPFIFSNTIAPKQVHQERVGHNTNNSTEGNSEESEAEEPIGNITRHFREAYQLSISKGGLQSLPISCAVSYLSRIFQYTSRKEEKAQIAFSLGAMLEGIPSQLVEKSFNPSYGWSQAEISLHCDDLNSQSRRYTPYNIAVNAAEVVREAINSNKVAQKAVATLHMLSYQGIFFALWALTGLVVMKLGRNNVRHLGPLFLPWAVVYLVTQPDMRWLGLGEALKDYNPALILFGLSFVTWKTPLSSFESRVIQSSIFAYPGFVLFVGLGWLILSDLSTYGHPDNRFQAVYQQAYVFIAFVLVSTFSNLSLSLSRAGLFLWTLPILISSGSNKRATIFNSIYLLIGSLIVVLIKLFLGGHRQNTSEIFRLAYISGVSWFLMARAETLLYRWGPRATKEDAGDTQVSHAIQKRIVWAKLSFPIFAIIFFVFLGLIVTQDKGPLLVLAFCSGIFISLLISRFVQIYLSQRLSVLIGMLALLPYVYFVSFLLYKLGGAFGGYISERIESATTPFLASNDQIAHILWFQQAAMENQGFGFGAIPWCGELSASCWGVPVQIQSDYMPTALIGVFGGTSWILIGFFVFWLWQLAKSHPAVTSGRVESDSLDQGWLSWITLCWVALTLTQFAVNIAGNRGWLPLTGISFPFLSYGASSLFMNSLFFALSIHLHRKPK